VADKIDRNRRQHTFELFGYDFMLDDEFKVFLIECNTNPCLAVPCPLLSSLISNVLDNTFRIALDPLYAPKGCRKTADSLQRVKWELIYDEEKEGLNKEL